MLNTNHAAHVLGIAPRTLSNARYSGVLLGFPYPVEAVELKGRFVSYRRADLLAWRIKYGLASEAKKPTTTLVV